MSYPEASWEDEQAPLEVPKDAYTSLEERGFAVLRAGGEAAFDAVAKSLGSIVQLYDVRVRPETPALVTSAQALGPHTDHHAVQFIAWHCVRPATRGGVSILVDGWRVLHALTPSDRDALRRVVLYEHRVFPEDRGECPMLREENGRPLLYYSYWLRRSLSEKGAQAFRRFRALSESKRLVHFVALEADDILVVDNQRVLHGRTAIDAPFIRHLRRAWIRKPHGSQVSRTNVRTRRSSVGADGASVS